MKAGCLTTFLLSLILLATMPFSASGNVYNVYHSKSTPIRAETPKVILQQGTAGTSTIYTNNTSAKVTVNATLWLDGWSYRKSHMIGNATGAGTNYQIRVVVHYGAGTDSGADVYVNGKCRTDFGDIRFTDDDQVTLLDYWMEEKVDSDYAVFWVEIADDLGSANQKIYIYYGKSDAITTSNLDDTAVFGQDFRTEQSISASKWVTSGSPTISFDSTNGLNMTSSDVAHLRSVNAYDFSAHKRVISEYKQSPNLEYGAEVTICPTITTNNVYFEVDWIRHTPNANFPDSDYFQKKVNGTISLLFSEPIDVTAFFKRDLYLKVATSNAYVHYVRDGVAKYSNGTETLWSATSNYIYVHVAAASGNTISVIIKYVAIFKYVDPEPSHGAWGIEETRNWLSGWGYRKGHVINNATGARTNYQALFNVYQGSGVDNGNSVYLNGHNQSTFPNDIRFTDDDGQTLLNYWVEDYNSTWAKVWVKIADDLSSSNQTIYIYYGNPSAESASDVNGTLEATYTKVDVPYEWIERISTTDVANGDDVGSWQNIPFSFPFWREFKNRIYVCSNGFGIFDPTPATNDYSNSLAELMARWKVAPFWDDLRTDVAGGGVSTPGAYVDGYADRMIITWETTRYGASADSIKFQVILYRNGDVRFNIDNATNFSNFTPTLGLSKGDNTNYIDITNERNTQKSWLFTLRKYVNPEPTHGAWGDEQRGQTFDYVLKVVNQVADNWNVRLRTYNQTNISRLFNCTIYFHDGGGVSRQIYIYNGTNSQQFGNWYDLNGLSAVYIAMTVSAMDTGTSYVYAYLEVLVPATSTYNLMVITFEIT